MPVLGIDYGAKRVGLAIAQQSHPERLQTLPNDDQLLHRLLELTDDQKIDTVVIGLPRNLDGDDTAQTAVVRRFAADLEKQAPGLKIVLQDEADTSNLARVRLQAQKVLAQKLDALLDQEAAVIILEDYLASV